MSPARANARSLRNALGALRTRCFLKLPAVARERGGGRSARRGAAIEAATSPGGDRFPWKAFEAEKIRRLASQAPPAYLDSRGERQMFIQTEATPNPATLKFLPGRTVMEDGTFEARDRAEAERSPLARARRFFSAWR